MQNSVNRTISLLEFPFLKSLKQWFNFYKCHTSSILYVSLFQLIENGSRSQEAPETAGGSQVVDAGQAGRRLHDPLQLRPAQASRVDADAALPQEQAQVRAHRQGVQAHHEAAPHQGRKD